MSKYYVLLDGFKTGVFKKKNIDFNSDCFNNTKIYKFNSSEEAENFFKKNKSKTNKTSGVAVLINENKYSVYKINKDMKISKKNNNADIKVFKNNNDALKFINVNEKNHIKMINSNSYVCDPSSLYKDLFDYAKVTREKCNKNIQKANKLIAYVDGSYNQIDKKYGAGIVIFANKEEEKNMLEKISICGNNKNIVNLKNVSGEIISGTYAINYALEYGANEIDIYYDYSGIKEHAENNKYNKYLFFIYNLYYKKAKNKIQINFIKVKAHSGNRYNNMADKLANKGCK